MKVSGILIEHAALTAAEQALTGQRFTLRDFAHALENQGVPVSASYEAAKRHLQNRRRSGGTYFDKMSGTWEFLRIPAPHPKPPVQTHLVPDWHGLPTLKRKEPIPEPIPFAVPIPVGLIRGLGGTLALLTCLVSIGALVFINATFALEFAETPIFQYALVSAFMACDLLRPLLVARGMFDIGRRSIFRGILGILIAVSLAPLSVLSSTSVLSATMQLGVQANERALALAESRDVMRTQYDLILVEIDRAWRAHKLECNRGGCGPKALAIAEKARNAEDKATALMSELLAKTEDVPKTSSFVSRTVQAFEELGLFSQERLILLPLLIALTLELAALFGPALLLAGRRPKIAGGLD